MSKNAKRYLMLLAAVGLIAVVAGGSSGTFASFNAQVANTGNYFATGTLFLHATKQGSSNVCKSEADNVGNANILAANGCDTLFTVSNLTPGVPVPVNLELDNAGSINASKLQFSLGTNVGTAGCVNGKGTITTTTQAITAGAQSTLHVSALPYALFAGTQLTITDGTNSENVNLAANAAVGALTLTVTGSTTNGYASGSKIQYAATFGTSNLCSNLLFSVQQMSSNWGANEKCIYGGGTGTNCAFTATTVNSIGTTLNDLTPNLQADGMTSAVDAGGSRWIQISIEEPSNLTNANQNQSATFDLKWDLEQ